MVIALALTLGYSAVEALAGWWSGSLALLSDAGHMLGDGAALGIAAFAAWAARQGPSPRHTYGFARAEVVAAMVNAALMLAIIVGIAITAVQRLLDPQPVQGETVIGVALVGLLVNAGVALMLTRAEKTMNTRGALLHVMGDLLGSFAALLSGAVVTVTGWTPVDPLLSLLICGLILVSSLRLSREALHALMEGTPLHLSLEEIGRAMAGLERVKSVHDLHVWTISSDRIALSAHLMLDDMRDWENVRRAALEMLSARYGIAHVTLQPETTTAIVPLKRS
jgi:cobalt-zinc-cadmium efflux system protein